MVQVLSCEFCEIFKGISILQASARKYPSSQKYGKSPQKSNVPGMFLLLVKLQAFSVNDSKRVKCGVRFLLQAVTDLFLAKPHAFIINSSDGFCKGVFNGIGLQL